MIAAICINAPLHTICMDFALPIFTCTLLCPYEYHQCICTQHQQQQLHAFVFALVLVLLSLFTFCLPSYVGGEMQLQCLYKAEFRNAILMCRYCSVVSVFGCGEKEHWSTPCYCNSIFVFMQLFCWIKANQWWILFYDIMILNYII